MGGSGGDWRYNPITQITGVCATSRALRVTVRRRGAAYPDPAVGAVKEKFESNPLWGKLKGTRHDVDDTVWMSAVGMQGAHALLDDVAEIFKVDPAKTS
ncbi:hypothetical protein GCM10017559_84750 [Streptosporangium longisporum]|uniref:Uncharacterized protein n=1 Tax=Streptosporangium longisporum TaxID=46187 RepID=A0ABP6LKL2_9ACTN